MVLSSEPLERGTGRSPRLPEAVFDHNGVPHDMDHLLAYIDPGSGSLVIQAVIATIVAVPFFFRQQIGRLVRAIRREDGKSSGRVTPPDGSS